MQHRMNILRKKKDKLTVDEWRLSEFLVLMFCIHEFVWNVPDYGQGISLIKVYSGMEQVESLIV